MPRSDDFPPGLEHNFPGDEADDPFVPRRPRRVWLRSVAAWDGALPWLVSSSPLILPYCLPGVDFGTIAFFCVGVIPLVAALTRGHLAGLQLQRLFPEKMPVGRQVLIALAIVTVFMFEVACCLLHCARKKEPVSAWLLPAGLYAAYFLLTAIALRPRRETVDGAEAV